MRQPQNTLLSAFLAWERQTPQQIFLRQVGSDGVRSWSYKEAGDEMRRLAAALNAQKFPPGAHIAILSRNCAHWVLADLAIMMAGHVTVPVDPALDAQSVHAILSHADVKAIFLGPASERISRDTTRESIARISFPSVAEAGGLTWDNCVAQYAPIPASTPAESSCATIMYNATVKGAMFSHAALSFSGTHVAEGLRLQPGLRFCCHLPLSSAEGRLFGELAPVCAGGTLCFGDTQAKVLHHEHPSVFVANADTFAAMRQSVLKSWSETRLRQLLRVPGVEVFMKEHIRKKLGLHRAFVVICAGGPAPSGLPEWFAELGIDLRESFGTLESGGYSHANFRLIRNGTIGQPWPWVEVRLDKSNALQVRHPGLMSGYYNDPAATAEVLTADGFLRTGFRGAVDPQGFVTLAVNSGIPPSVSALEVNQN